MSLSLSVVIPYYNEAAWIGDTLRDLIAQSDPPDRLILVDNGSTDGSAGLCREVLGTRPDLRVLYASEPTPGKIHALARAGSLLETDLAAFWDADTRYPPHYLRRCRELAQENGEEVVAFIALDVHGSPDKLPNRLRRRFFTLFSRVARHQCFTGGYGQTFRTGALRRSGGFSAARWPYVLLDHEIIHRLHKIGETRYDFDLWCRPSTRRSDRRRVRWTLAERLLYLLVPFAFKDWYFYSFLAARFARRGLNQLRLREKPWQPREM